MINYDDLVTTLEDAWSAAGLHEHTLSEQVIPMTLERAFRAELFPDHPEPMTEESMPPWLEMNFVWNATHQLSSDALAASWNPLDIIWTYNVSLRGPTVTQSDGELIRRFHRAIQTALWRFYPNERNTLSEPYNVEVRHNYRHDGQKTELVAVQLVGMGGIDISEHLNGATSPDALLQAIASEFQLIGAVLTMLRDVFDPNGQGGYQTVDAA